MNTSYSVHGMTCESCEKTIETKLGALSGVMAVHADRGKNLVTIEASRVVSLGDVQQGLKGLSQYRVSENAAAATKSKSWLTTYRPLIMLFGFVGLVSFAYQTSLAVFDSHLLMNHLMAGFFVGLSFFKFLDLKAFARSFAGYDPLAKQWLGYGYVYPFIELGLGLMFVSGVAPSLANGVTIGVLGLTTLGVLKRLQSKSQFQCACLGTTFNLPLSYVTVAENVVMVAMAVVGLTRA